MIVMMTAMTPSVKASSRALLMGPTLYSQEAWACRPRPRRRPAVDRSTPPSLLSIAGQILPVKGALRLHDTFRRQREGSRLRNGMLLPSELSPPTSRDWITAGGGHGGRQSRVPPALDGETAGVLGPQHPEGGDLGPSRRPEARVDGGRGGGVA